MTARALTLLLLLLLPSSAFAQVPAVKNPTALSFTSIDHAMASGYEVDIVTSTGVLQTIVTGKGTQDAAGIVTLILNVQPIAFGTYTFRIRAVAGKVESLDSPSSDPWDRVPGPPGKATIK